MNLTSDIDFAVNEKRESGRAVRILCVDDDVTICHLAAIVLTHAGYNVIMANDGCEAWKLLNSESFDLLLTDNKMPELSGEDLVFKVRQHGMDIPIILMSGQFAFSNSGENLLKEISKVVKKPFYPPELVEAVKLTLHAKR